MEQDDSITSTGNFEQFQDLFRRNHKFLCMVALNHVNDKYIAEDIVQEFFINFWQRKNTIQLKGTFEAYARRAVKYSSIDYVRKQEVTSRRTAALPQMEEGYDPQAETESAELKYSKYLRILEMVLQLPEDRRRIFIMHAMDGLSHSQIADQLGISVNTVKTQLRRAYFSIRSKAIILLLFILLMYVFISRYQ